MFRTCESSTHSARMSYKSSTRCKIFPYFHDVTCKGIPRTSPGLKKVGQGLSCLVVTGLEEIVIRVVHGLCVCQTHVHDLHALSPQSIQERDPP